MARRKSVNEKELTEILSAIARGDIDGEAVKVSERLKAAELLEKTFSSFAVSRAGDGEIRLVVDYVGKSD